PIIYTLSLHDALPIWKLEEGDHMNYLLIRHKVADFAKWKPAYDAHGRARANAGLKEERLLRSIDNPNEVVLLFSAQDLDKAKQRSEEHTSELQSRFDL